MDYLLKKSETRNRRHGLCLLLNRASDCNGDSCTPGELRYHNIRAGCRDSELERQRSNFTTRLRPVYKCIAP